MSHNTAMQALIQRTDHAEALERIECDMSQHITKCLRLMVVCWLTFAITCFL